MTSTLRGTHHIAGLEKPLSQLALGTAFYRIEEKENYFPLLDEFLLAGGTLIDTGRHYGSSEAVIGEWLVSRGTRDQVVLLSKCGHGDCELPADGFEAMVDEELETSLKLLNTDRIDIYMLHRDNPAVAVERIIDRLNVEIDRHRVRTLGASNWTCDRVQAANDYARRRGLVGFTAVSNNLSLAVPTQPFYKGLVTLDDAAESWHVETGIPLIDWSAQARGFFTGAYSPDLRERFDEIDDDFQKRMIEVYCTDDNFERLRRAKELGMQKGGYSAVQIALAWLLNKPFPLMPIVGPRSREELISCVEAATIPLSQVEQSWLELAG